MTPRKTATPGSETGGADYLTTTNTPKDGIGITSTDATSFGAMLDRPLTTTRTCAGQFCWCRIGDYPSPLVMDHVAELARMARDLRRLEISAGVMGI